MASVTDEIFEKYLQKAIAETNELGDEIAHAAGEGQVPVLGSGHPLAIYGTNCLKLVGGDEAEARSWLARELHIVQPKLIVVMGEPALEFLNAVEFPLADPLEPKLGELQRFTATIQALFVPDIDESLDEAPAKTQFWNAFKPLGSWWAELPPY